MTCIICEYQTPAGIYLCGKHGRMLRELLLRVPDTLKTAGQTLANLGVRPSNGSSGTGEPPAPINLNMEERLGEYVKRLVELGHWANGELEPNKLRIFTNPTKAAEYLHAVTTQLIKREDVGDLYWELASLERAVISAADIPRSKRPLGECGALDFTEDGAVTRCDGIIEGHETSTVGRCKTCKREHDTADRIRNRITEAWHVRAPLRQIVNALKEAGYPVSYNTAKSWARRGKLAPTCDLATRQEGHTPAEVLKVIQETASLTGRIAS